MNETVVAKSYMNHDQPQSSKSITRTCSPSASRLASRMSACTRPKRSPPWPKASSRRRMVASSRPSSASSSAPIPRPSCHRPQWPLGTERRRVVPAEAGEAGGRRPAARVAVHARRDGAQRAEAGPQVVGVGVGHLAPQPLEEHDVALAQLVRPHLADAAAVTAGDGDRGLDHAVLAQRVDPVELRGDLGGGVVRRPVHAQRERAAAAGLLHPVGPVLRDVDQPRRTRPGRGRSSRRPPRPGGRSPPDQCSRPSTDSSTRVISSRARSTLAVAPLM